MKNKKMTSIYAFLVLAVVSLSACAEMPRKHGTMTDSTTAAPVSIGFDAEGNLQILDEKGNRVEPMTPKFPIAVDAIESVETMTILKLKGSCYYLMQLAGMYYQVPLPPQFCSQ